MLTSHSLIIISRLRSKIAGYAHSSLIPNSKNGGRLKPDHELAPIARPNDDSPEKEINQSRAPIHACPRTVIRRSVGIARAVGPIDDLVIDQLVMRRLRLGRDSGDASRALLRRPTSMYRGFEHTRRVRRCS
ncbi:unnamed protein product [Prunus armeniaca]|uniref:Uncharacterized protein n=1 Tax=Prunus armeniaca TaxID=36596 RepID=A0A6J5TN61_PRUAR|nr:unnamed protein product [Prunus armeniaca]